MTIAFFLMGGFEDETNLKSKTFETVLAYKCSMKFYCHVSHGVYSSASIL